jgi:hypothetical protein
MLWPLLGVAYPEVSEERGGGEENIDMEVAIAVDSFGREELVGILNPKSLGATVLRGKHVLLVVDEADVDDVFCLVVEFIDLRRGWGRIKTKVK